MNPTAIYSKTGKGVQESSGKTSLLSRADRAVLTQIDGKTTFADLQIKFYKLDATSRTNPSLSSWSTRASSFAASIL